MRNESVYSAIFLSLVSGGGRISFLWAFVLLAEDEEIRWTAWARAPGSMIYLVENEDGS